jgi:hypothetical protein
MIAPDKCSRALNGLGECVRSIPGISKDTSAWTELRCWVNQNSGALYLNSSFLDCWPALHQSEVASCAETYLNIDRPEQRNVETNAMIHRGIVDHSE